jgi:hypothetical protein
MKVKQIRMSSELHDCEIQDWLDTNPMVEIKHVAVSGLAVYIFYTEAKQ